MIDILNVDYYNKLIEKYSINKKTNIIEDITQSIIIENYGRKNVFFTFPINYKLEGIINQLYEHISNEIFINYADLTDYSVGDKLKRSDEKGKNTYIIKKIIGSDYILTKDNDTSNIEKISSFDKLKRNYIQIKQNARNSTLSKYYSYFKKISSSSFGFLPTHFSKKIVLIAGQTTWNNLKNKDCIPTIYLPNTREGEQTIRKSIVALEDCISYVTPKYEVCYDEILRKNIAVETILICDTDLSTLPQIIQDQSKYKFKLVVISTGNENLKLNSIINWNWKVEEIYLLQQLQSSLNKNVSEFKITERKKIDIECINDSSLTNLIFHFENCMAYVNSLEVPIFLMSYCYFFRLVLNALHEEDYGDLLIRLQRNKDLELNEGGYDDFLDYNPKKALTDIINYLKENSLKLLKIRDIISNSPKNTIFVVEQQDISYLEGINKNRCKIVTTSDLKKQIKTDQLNNRLIVFYSFNGSKDFDFIYNLSNDIKLVLYEQEKDLYDKQFQNKKNQLEKELSSEDRFNACGIKYIPTPKQEVKVSPTLEQIIERIEQRSDTAYDIYKNESDSLLDDLEEDVKYRVLLDNGESVDLGSNETVFNHAGDLIKSFRIKVGNKIRLYPKDQLAENLFQIAVEVEKDKFGKIDEHSEFWKNALKYLEEKYKSDLYNKLKEKGLRVMSSTVDSYYKSNRKFPMFNSDLKAILDLSSNELLYTDIKKSKRLYNSTMIALGRGIKQELKQFLKDKSIGDILKKKDFTAETMQKFINEYMPLLAVVKIEEISNEQ